MRAHYQDRRLCVGSAYNRDNGSSLSADTEIDWKAYMQQVQQVIDGERDYTMIKGDTGPLVYPAIHVYIYRALHTLTQQGTNIVLAQVIFAVVYIFNLSMAMACYAAAEVRIAYYGVSTGLSI